MYTSKFDPFLAAMKSHKFLFTQNPFVAERRRESKGPSMSIYSRVFPFETEWLNQRTEVPIIGKSEQHLGLQPCPLV